MDPCRTSPSPDAASACEALSEQAVAERFAHCGLRRTRQREVIYRELARTCSHPTAEELLRLAHVHTPELSLATVYNTLEALVRGGLCRKIAPAGGGAWRYDADLHPHAHVSREDGTLVDLPEDLSRRIVRLDPALVEEVERRLGIKVRGVAVQVVAEG